MSINKKKNFKNLTNTTLVKGLLSLATKGYFEEKGWNISYIKKQSLDADGSPIPWLTYSFLDFLKGRLNSEMTLFEYGSGNSTLFFSKILKKVDAVEDDIEWFNKIKALMPNNVNIQYHSLENTEYENCILNAEEEYDLIIIDGRKRVKCLKNSIKKIKPHGVIILDDAERIKYTEAFAFMKENGYKNIPFSGIAIGAIHPKETTVFYREENCLNI